jgi:30S ribosomal protein S31
LVLKELDKGSALSYERGHREESTVRGHGSSRGNKESSTVGKGDVRTRRGKIYRGTYGKSRPKGKKAKPKAKK